MVSVSCFGVRVSVMFHFMFVHYTFSSVWVAEWPPFGVKSDVRFLIFGENFLLLEGRKCILLSAPRSQFVAIGPATI